MPGNATKLGPFVGGLNNKSRTGEARADELVEMVNFEVTSDETLTSRPPLEMIKGTVRNPVSPEVEWDILCIYRRSPSEWYLIVSEPLVDAGVDKVKVNAYLNGDLNSSPTLIEAATTSENRVADAVQFADEVFFIRNVNASLPGFKWGPTSGYQAIPAMPRGKVIVSWKTRLWIAGRTDTSGLGAQLRYSDIEPDGPKPEKWNASNYVDVAYGEGGFITSLIPLQNNLVIFKSDGAWRFSYPSQVKDGQVDVLSSSIGAASRHAAIELENVVYVYDQGSIYEMVNSNFTKINKTLDVIPDPYSVNTESDSVQLSVLNRRIMVTYSNAVYALNIETKAWSQWRSFNGTPGRFVELPASSSTSSSPVYISASCGVNLREEVLLRGFNSISDMDGTAIVEDDQLRIYSGNTVQLSAPFSDGDSAAQSFNIPISVNQDINLSFELIEGTAPVVKFDKLEASGSITTDIVTPTISGTTVSYKKKITGTDGTSPLALRIFIENTSLETASISGLTVRRTAGKAPAVLFKIQDSYEESAISKELIVCKIKTRSTDFSSPQTWKRLYWWGLDIKTYFETVAVAVPAAKEPKVYWREIDQYTNSQLLQGTFRNPLSWLLRSVSVFNRHEPEYDLSSDGRFFKKLAKALRFQRISFEYETKTHGTLATGPAKVFTITPMVKDKRVVVDTNT